MQDRFCEFGSQFIVYDISEISETESIEMLALKIHTNVKYRCMCACSIFGILRSECDTCRDDAPLVWLDFEIQAREHTPSAQ